MRGGLLRRWVVIQENLPSRDSAGAEVDDWQTFAVGWGDVRPLATGAEGFSSDQPFAEQYYQIRMRWTSVLATATPKMRAVSEGKTFDIERIHDESDRRREIRIYARLLNP